MALSHPCPASLSQLNEPFPRQIKTGETAFTRGKGLRKAIQTGMVGRETGPPWAEGREDKGRAAQGRGAGQEGPGRIQRAEPYRREAQHTRGIRDTQESEGRWKGRGWRGGDPGGRASSACRSCKGHRGCALGSVPAVPLAHPCAPTSWAAPLLTLPQAAGPTALLPLCCCCLIESCC